MQHHSSTNPSSETGAPQVAREAVVQQAERLLTQARRLGVAEHALSTNIGLVESLVQERPWSSESAKPDMLRTLARWRAVARDLEDTVVALALRVQSLTDAQAAHGWQPIATAPKDGSVIIGYDASRIYEPEEGIGSVEFMRWRDGCWMDPATHSMKPTHWMPLPAPPVAPDQDEMRRP